MIMKGRDGEETTALVCVGKVTGAYGVRGLVRVRSYMAAPEDIVMYGPLMNNEGCSFRLRIVGICGKNNLTIAVEGIKNRDAALALVGEKFFVSRSCFPEPQADEFYHFDLIGCRAEGLDGVLLGDVQAVFTAGGGDVLDITRPGRVSLLIPFTRQAVPIVDLARRLVVINPPSLVDGKENS